MKRRWIDSKSLGRHDSTSTVEHTFTWTLGHGKLALRLRQEASTRHTQKVVEREEAWTACQPAPDPVEGEFGVGRNESARLWFAPCTGTIDETRGTAGNEWRSWCETIKCYLRRRLVIIRPNHVEGLRVHFHGRRTWDALAGPLGRHCQGQGSLDETRRWSEMTCRRLRNLREEL